MTKEELKDYLVSLGFSYERDTEYNRDVYTNNLFFVANRNTKMVIYVCYYTMRFEWWYEPNKKVGTSFYLAKILPTFSDKFIADTVKGLQEKYNIKYNNMETKQKVTGDFAWRIYNFVNNWKTGNYGNIPLQEALDKDFDI